MTRLYDRVTRGCPPFRLADLLAGTPFEERLGQQLGESDPSLAEALAPRDLGRLSLRTANPTGRARMPLDVLRGAPVIAVDNVGDYCAQLPEGPTLADLVATVAPPFETFFLECAPALRRAGTFPLHAWGFLCGGADLTTASWSAKVPDRRLDRVLSSFSTGRVAELPEALAGVPVRWMLQLVLVLEVRKGAPCGPAAEWNFPLDDDGHLICAPGGRVVGIEGLVDLEPPMGAQLPQLLMEAFDAMVVPALFSLSLMHCKNVRMHPVRQDPPRTKSARRRSPGPLVRYHVLDIGPMQEILDAQGQARRRGLGAALHICRGHFKTFGDDAPLFGKHTGTYFWHEQARGTAKRGAVATDYRIVPPVPAE